MQVMGLVLLVPLAIAIYDRTGKSSTAIFSHPEVIGFMIAIIAALLTGSACDYIFRKGKELQGRTRALKRTRVPPNSCR